MKTKCLLLLLAPAFSLTTYFLEPGTNSLREGLSVTPNAAVEVTPNAAIERTLSAIRDDLKRLRPRFPQLASIADAVIKRGELRYEKGLLKDGKLEGPVFDKDGCDIYVAIKYPATREDVMQRPLGGSLFLMKNGKSFAVWILVRAENNEPGIALSTKVKELVSVRVTELEKKLAID
jgi:hypothetical protein